MRRARTWLTCAGVVTLLALAVAAPPATAAKQTMVIKWELHKVPVGTEIGSSPEFSPVTGPGLTGCSMRLVSTLTGNEESKDKFGTGTLTVVCEAGASWNSVTLQSVEITAKGSGSIENEVTHQTELVHKTKIKASPLVLTLAGCSYTFKKLPAQVNGRANMINDLTIDGSAVGKLNKEESAVGCAKTESVSYELPIITGGALSGGHSEEEVLFEEKG